MQLTNADRRVLLDNFRTLSADWIGENSDLIDYASEWTASLVPTFGFERSLAGDVFVLCETLRKATSPETTRLARGGLAYLYRNNHVDPLTLGSLGLLDDAFVAGYAAHAVREKTGGVACYCPPRLAADEQARAEAIFLQLLDHPDDSDDVVAELATLAIGKLGHLLESGLFRRLRMNIGFLSHVLADAGRPKDHRQIARAALHYVAEEREAIPDSLGLIGYLDDYFIADLAVGLIAPGQSPWMNLIDAVVGAWPFLNMVSFGDSQVGTAASEFLMVNAALTCPVVRGSESDQLTHLVLPRIGPVPLLLGFFASLGELLAARRREGSTMSFEIGQKVLVDGKGGAYTFEGRQIIGGQIKFGVGKIRKERGQTLRAIQWMPIEDLYRLVPSDPDRSVRGRLAVSDRRSEPLGALDFLFLAAEIVTVPPDLPQVVIVTPVGPARQTAESVTLFGQRLCDIVPMGSLTMSGDQMSWSGRFGSSRPAVLIIPDMDRACEYIEGEDSKAALTIVDVSGHNAGRLASLSRLQQMGSRLLVTVSQADADALLEDDSDSLVWEWDRTDFESVLVEPGHATPTANPVETYERAVVRAVSSDVKVIPVQLPEADQAYHSVSALKRLAEARGEDVPAELEDALNRSFSLLTRLLRCPFRLSSHPSLHSELRARSDSLVPTNPLGVFLSEAELAAVATVERSLRALCNVLEQGNPKEDALFELRRSSPKLIVVCNDVELLDEAEQSRACPVSSALEQSPGSLESGHVLAGWFNRSTMTRLLRPPFATPLYLLLYSPEILWHRGFNHRIRDGAATRRSRAARGRVFPGVGKWPDQPVNGQATHDESADETPDAIQLYLLAERRKRLTSLVTALNGEDSVKARLITFDGGYAFLTDDYRAKVATHLLGSTANSEEAELEMVPAHRLQRGDVLLFLRGSSRDVIREVADRFLLPGERERAATWRRALINYQRRMDCCVEVIWRRLGEHGCPLSLAAVTNWFTDENIISPLRVDREFAAILALTQDTDLRDGLDTCRAAVRRVKGAHLRASNQLARKVVEQAVSGLKSAVSTGGAMDLGEGIFLARITDIDDTPIRVKASSVNRLVEEDKQWHV